MLNLPENFETYTDARKAGFMKMKELKEQGKRVVGIYCSFVPTELIEAADAAAVSLCASSEEPIPAAEADLPRNLCPLIKASYGFALTDTCPYFYFSDLIVGETTCDGKKKMFELMNRLKETYVMQLPTYRNEVSLKAWEDEISRFWKKLEDFFGITITQERVREAIRLKNKERLALRRFLELGKLYPAPISGYELGTRLDSVGFTPDIEKRCRIIDARTDEILKAWEEKTKSGDDKADRNGETHRPRILVTGCPNSGMRDKTIKAIEELGAQVVAFDCCNGIREKLDLVDEDLPPVEALAKKYLNINCSVMSPNPGRIDNIRSMIRDYRIDGVMELVLTACHTYAIESFLVKEAAEEMNVGYLKIDTDFSKSDTGQIGTRLAAFLETIG